VFAALGIIHHLVSDVRFWKRRQPPDQSGDSTADMSLLLHPHGLGFPVVHVLMLFLGGDIVQRNGELERTGGLLDLALEVSSGGHQLRCAERRDVALFQLALNAAKLFAESVHAVGSGGEPLFAERFEFDGVQVLDLELVFAAPGDERGFGDIEFNHEPGVGPALGSELYEFVDNFLILHCAFLLRFLAITSDYLK